MSQSNNSRSPADADGKGHPSPVAVSEQLKRILDSPRFAESPRLCAFLRYVVEAKLARREDQIQEYTIGVEVFDRGESFDPRIDSIVRVEAGRLRDRLGEYYAAAGRDDPIAIDLPLGGYKPRFSENGARELSDGQPVWHWTNIWRVLSGAWFPRTIALLAVAVCTFLLLRTPSAPSTGTVSFSLAAPSGAELLTPRRGGGPVVSPDGRRVVFAVRNQSGQTFLCIRSMDRVRAARLAKTENAVWPFWSPDGNKVAFWALGKLKVLDLRRDDVLALAEVPNFQGGTWSDFDGGVIVISTTGGPLSRIPVTGGTPQPVLSLDQTEFEHRQPFFLPDGRKLLYTSVRRDAPRPLIRIADIETGESIPFPQAASEAKYAQTSDGRHMLLFNDSGTLSARKVDPGTLEFLSPADSLVGGLRPDMVGTFSVAGSTLAYFDGPFPVGNSNLVWRSRSGERLGTLGKTANYIWISLSLDERMVAAAIPTYMADVWTIDVATGIATRQTRHPKLDRSPIWSPDGRQLLMSTDRDGDGGRIYILSADGSGEAKPWLDYPRNRSFSDWPSHWHPKTATVLFSRNGEGGQDVWMKSSRSEPRDLIAGPGDQINAHLSPGARHVAYASSELGDWQIFLAAYPPTGSRIRVSPDGGNFPLWNANGRELFYVAPDGSIMAVDVSTGQRLKASLPRRLFRVKFPVSPAPMVYQYAVANDANRFLVVEEIEGPSATAILNWERLLDQ